jgi:hypothetical protein
VTWYETDHGQAVAEFLGPQKTEEEHDRVTKLMVYQVAHDGAVQGSFELRLHHGQPVFNERAEDFVWALGLPSPVALVSFEVWSFSASATDPPPDYATAVGDVLKHAWPAWVAVIALSTVLAAIAWRRGRAFGLSRREQAAWAAFVLLFGVPACVGFLLHRRWPVREPCPHCHARCPRDRDACAECGTRFPAPALKGIEIFA